jgi:hypothetical protein
MKTIKIHASYVHGMDNYVANVIMNGKDYNLTSRNGSDLPAKVKALTGVDIEYNFNQRTFLVPCEYSF